MGWLLALIAATAALLCAGGTHAQITHFNATQNYFGYGCEFGWIGDNCTLPRSFDVCGGQFIFAWGCSGEQSCLNCLADLTGPQGTFRVNGTGSLVPSRGQCFPTGCVCNIPYYTPNCRLDSGCSLTGTASVDINTGACTCRIPSYGTKCTLLSNCAVNGTSSVNVTNGACICKRGWNGTACASQFARFDPIANYLGYGCEVGWIGDLCNIPRSFDPCGGQFALSWGCSGEQSCANCLADLTGPQGTFRVNGTGSLVPARGLCTGPAGCTCNIPYWQPNCRSDSGCSLTGTASVNITTGVCTCKPGWTGALCATIVCSSPGTLQTNPNNTCTCNSGWNGTTCATPTCANGATLVNGTSCLCTGLFWGPLCRGTPQCNSANAQSVNQTNGACLCKPNFLGSLCTCIANNTAIADSPIAGLCLCKIPFFPWGTCQTRGACDLNGTASVLTNGACVCKPGWVGTLCGNLTCTSNTFPPACVCPANTGGAFCCPVRSGVGVCGLRGTCLSSGTCQCDVGWTGAACDVGPCGQTNISATPCTNGNGVCNTTTNQCDCSRTKSWYGSQCQTPTGCVAANTLAVNQTSGACLCKPNFLGSLCTCIANNTAIVDSPIAGLCVCKIPFFPTGTCQTRAACDLNGTASVLTNGACVCKPGWVGTLCGNLTCTSNTFPPACVCPANTGGAFCCPVRSGVGVCGLRGTCLSSGTCQCDVGWTGAACDVGPCGQTNISATPCTNGNGVCNTTTNQCDCSRTKSWYGSQCQLQSSCDPILTLYVDQTSGVCQCIVGAVGTTCSNIAGVSSESYLDRSNYGDAIGSPYSTLCAVTVNDTQRCNNHGCCQDPLNPIRCLRASAPLRRYNWFCQCDGGWAGLACEQPLCYTGGTVPSLRWETCTCKPGFGAPLCACPTTRDPKTPLSPTLSKCGGHGTCNDITGGCVCAPGYSGEYCCLGGCSGVNGVCTVNAALVPVCECTPGWSGSNCNITTAGCPPNFCNFRGTCLGTSQTGFSCQCTAGWNGSRCETGPCGMTALNGNVACSNRGLCVNNSFCVCDGNSAWTGAVCQTATGCNPAHTIGYTDAGGCLCTQDFGGTACTIQKGVAPNTGLITGCTLDIFGSGSVCSSNGACVQVGASLQQCRCDPGWGGLLCDVPLCVDSHTFPNIDWRTCNCRTPWIGTFCQCLPDSLQGPVYNCSLGCEAAACTSATNGACNAVTSKCVCTPGFYGPKCQNRCPTNFAFSTRTQSCTGCTSNLACGYQIGGACDLQTNECNCLEGWYGAGCASRCLPDGLSYNITAQACSTCSSTGIITAPCSGHGSCSTTTGRCTCDPGWFGTLCATGCPTGLTASGTRCICQQSSSCNNGGTCDAFGTGQCVCSPGFFGPTCLSACPANFAYSAATGSCSLCRNNAACNSRQTCNVGTGACVCIPPFNGTDCGSCFDATEDYLGFGCCSRYVGSTCSIGAVANSCGQLAFVTGPVSISCSGDPSIGVANLQGVQGATCAHGLPCRGQCVSGPTRCQCNIPFYGGMCQFTSACDVTGTKSISRNGTCTCLPGYGGSLCDISGCYGPGRMPNTPWSSCQCKQSWSGDLCSCPTVRTIGVPFTPLSVCGGHGTCNTTSNGCRCDAGFGGTYCCPLGCSNFAHATCEVVARLPTCVCTLGWTGTTCNIPDPCTTCNGRGTCDPTRNATCICNDPLQWYGTKCQSPVACNLPGTVSVDPTTGACYCLRGWTGSLCDAQTGVGPACLFTSTTPGADPCWSRLCTASVGSIEICSGHGTCEDAFGFTYTSNGYDRRCVCDEGWEGETCEIPICPVDRSITLPSGNNWQKCLCVYPYLGERCECVNTVCGTGLTCPNDCTSHGRCSAATGTCACYDGWSGSACDQPDTTGPWSCNCDAAGGTCVTAPFVVDDVILGSPPVPVLWAALSETLGISPAVTTSCTTATCALDAFVRTVEFQRVRLSFTTTLAHAVMIRFSRDLALVDNLQQFSQVTMDAAVVGVQSPRIVDEVRGLAMLILWNQYLDTVTSTSLITRLNSDPYRHCQCFSNANLGSPTCTTPSTCLVSSLTGKACGGNYRDGFTGLCDTTILAGAACQCASRLAGAGCNIDLGDGCYPNRNSTAQCSIRGTCVVNSPGRSSCACNPGSTGRYCDQYVCSVMAGQDPFTQCNNAGLCGGDGVCTCNVATSLAATTPFLPVGDNCQVNGYLQCASPSRVECNGHGTCTLDVETNTPGCVCDNGFAGTRCEISLCGSPGCNTRETCDTTSGTCLCLSKWWTPPGTCTNTSITCRCAVSQCANGVPSDDGATCVCNANYRADLNGLCTILQCPLARYTDVGPLPCNSSCRVNTTLFAGREAQRAQSQASGGTCCYDECVDPNSGFSNCALNATSGARVCQCFSSVFSDPGDGVCRSLCNGFPGTNSPTLGLSCTCTDAATLATLNTPKYNVTVDWFSTSCLRTRCLNGGVVAPSRTGCRCLTGFAGAACQTPVCVNNGTLATPTATSCTCPGGWTGLRCDVNGCTVNGEIPLPPTGTCGVWATVSSSSTGQTASVTVSSSSSSSTGSSSTASSTGGVTSRSSSSSSSTGTTISSSTARLSSTASSTARTSTGVSSSSSTGVSSSSGASSSSGSSTSTGTARVSSSTSSAGSHSSSSSSGGSLSGSSSSSSTSLSGGAIAGIAIGAAAFVFGGAWCWNSYAYPRTQGYSPA